MTFFIALPISAALGFKFFFNVAYRVISLPTSVPDIILVGKYVENEEVISKKRNVWWD